MKCTYVFLEAAPETWGYAPNKMIVQRDTGIK